MVDRRQGTRIYFMVDGEIFAERTWWNVPQKGCKVTLGAGKKFKPMGITGQAAFEVETEPTYWGGGINDPLEDMGSVSLDLKPLSERLPDETP